MVDGAERMEIVLELAENCCFCACSSVAMYWTNRTGIFVSGGNHSEHHAMYIYKNSQGQLLSTAARRLKG